MASDVAAGRGSPWWARLIAGGAYAVMFVPLVTVAVYSFLAPLEPGGPLTPSLHWYRKLMAEPTLGDAMRRSLVVAAAASGIAAVVGAFGALAIERGRWPGQKLLAAVTVIPIALPELVQGIAALLWFSALSMSLGLISMTLAHATFAMSYVVVTVRARLRDHDPALEEAAADLGAAPLQVFLQVTLPLMLPGVVAGAMLAFALSFDDFLISFFTTGAGTDTLPIRLYALIRFGLNKEVYALSTLLIAVTAVGLLAHHMMLRPRR